VTTTDYEQFVLSNWRGTEPGSLREAYIMATGLGGETGEVLEWLKKDMRDGGRSPIALQLELGDVLYYLTRLGLEYGFTLTSIMDANKEKLDARRTTGSGA